MTADPGPQQSASSLQLSAWKLLSRQPDGRAPDTVTKNVLLVTTLSGWAAPRKGLAGNGLAALNRRGLSPAGGSRRENETGFVF